MSAIMVKFIALFVGITLEGIRLSRSASTFLKILLCSGVASLTVFLPSKHESVYRLEKHLANWPWIFLLVFLLCTTLFNGEKARPRLTEGVTFISSLSLLYLLGEYGRDNGYSWYLWLSLFPIGYSALCAFTRLDLDRSNRLVLSIWNSVILAVFGIKYFFSIVFMPTRGLLFSTAGDFKADLLVVCEFALLGAAGIYILYNLYMLIGFLPSRNRFFNEAYFDELRELCDEHIGRYSPVQIPPSNAAIALLLHGGPLLLNYCFRWLPADLVTWYSLALSPRLLELMFASFSTNEESDDQ